MEISEALPLPGTPHTARSTDQLVKKELDTEPIVERKPKSRKRLWLWIGAALVLLVAAGATVGALFGTHVIKIGSGNADAATSTSGSDSGSSSTGSGGGEGSNGGGGGTDDEPQNTAECTKADDIPSGAKGTYMDPTSWLDMTDFNCTFTEETVGDLPVVGLFSSWNDSAQANPNVPALNKAWGSYLDRPARGVNLGGWFSLEPFITPSLFTNTSIGDEWTLCKTLGTKEAAATLEKHYSTFITEDDFKAIAQAGLDHVRIPFSYWAVTTYDDDPYVAHMSWRYLLRAIEWARKYGIRVKLDLHGVPGSQNGWNHSGKQGKVNWISGPDGVTNAQRTLDIHAQLSKFFSQDRYKNVIAFYGLVNEPALSIDQTALIDWTKKAYDIVHQNGVAAPQVFSESMRGLPAWQGKLTGYGNSLIVDVHQYTIFSGGLLGLDHAGKINFACDSFMAQSKASIDTSTGFGPTMVGEWSQADTDCVQYLNGVGMGSRWEGTFSGGSPLCPTGDSKCSCDSANADPSTYSDGYKNFLMTFAIAQMDAFEASWGWFYWTWKTESAAQWSYKHGLDYGFMPSKAYERDWSCKDTIPSFGILPEYY